MNLWFISLYMTGEMMSTQIFDVRFYLPYYSWCEFSDNDAFNALMGDLITDYFAEFILQGGRTDDIDAMFYSGLEECPFDIDPNDYFDDGLRAIDEIFQWEDNADVVSYFSSPERLIEDLTLVAITPACIHYQITFKDF